MKPEPSSPPILPCDDFFLISRALDAVIYKEENEYHWLICALQTPGTEFEGSTLHNLHREIDKLKAAKTKLCNLFEKQYAKS